jgi:hypothetical protein
MTYWEFLIQREDDRSWKTLTSPNLQIVEGKYRIVANTSAIDATVRTQVFYHTDTQPPQLSQSRSQSVSPEGILVVLPFTHLQAGMWHFRCNVSISEETEEICQPLKLKVLPKSPVAVPSQPEKFTAEPQPAEIIEAAVGDLDRLLDGMETPPVIFTPVSPEFLAAQPAISKNPTTITSNPSSPVLGLPQQALEPLITSEEINKNEDPFDAALRIATADQQARTQARRVSLGALTSPIKPEPTLQQILAATTVEALVLGTPDVPLHSYDVKTYEVVVED